MLTCCFAPPPLTVSRMAQGLGWAAIPWSKPTACTPSELNPALVPEQSKKSTCSSLPQECTSAQGWASPGASCPRLQTLLVVLSMLQRNLTFMCKHSGFSLICWLRLSPLWQRPLVKWCINITGVTFNLIKLFEILWL